MIFLQLKNKFKKIHLTLMTALWDRYYFTERVWNISRPPRCQVAEVEFKSREYGLSFFLPNRSVVLKHACALESPGEGGLLKYSVECQPQVSNSQSYVGTENLWFQKIPRWCWSGGHTLRAAALGCAALESKGDWTPWEPQGRWQLPDPSPFWSVIHRKSFHRLPINIIC